MLYVLAITNLQDDGQQRVAGDLVDGPPVAAPDLPPPAAERF